MKSPYLHHAYDGFVSVSNQLHCYRLAPRAAYHTHSLTQAPEGHTQVREGMIVLYSRVRLITTRAELTKLRGTSGAGV